MKSQVRIAIRSLIRQPTFAVTAILALSLAIAVNTSMFSVIDAMLNPRVGARNPDQLLGIAYYAPPSKRMDATWRDRILGDSGRTYSIVTGWWFYGYGGGVVERGGVSINRAAPIYVRPNFFTAMEVTAEEGRLVPSPDPVAAAATVVISTQLRAELFRGGESAVGQVIFVDGKPYTIIGVTSRFPGFHALSHDVWMFPLPGINTPGRIIRLRPGESRATATSELALRAAQLALGEGVDPKESRFDVTPIKRQFQIKQFHWALIGAGLAILVVACTNLANLQLARGLGRAGELAVRSALGASRRQIIAQLMIESGVLAVAAVFVAMLLAFLGNGVIRATIPPSVGEYVIEPQNSWRMVVFAATIAVASLALVGLFPAIRVSRVDLNTLLKSRAGTGAHKANRRMYGALVITQIALTLPLVAAAVLLSRSAIRAAERDYRVREQFGFDFTPLVVARVFFPPTPDQKFPISAVAADLIARARSVPGVTYATVRFTKSPPGQAISVEEPDGGTREVETPSWSYTVVTPDYFRVMDLPIIRGRNFTDGVHADGAVILDAPSSQGVWPRSAAVGRLVKLGDQKSDQPWMRVQGIVGDRLSDEAREQKRQSGVRTVNSAYRLITERDSIGGSRYLTAVSMIVRTEGDPAVVASALRRKLSDVTSRPPGVMTMEESEGIPQQIATLRFVAGLFTTFGILALCLSGLGVYGIVAQSVIDRKREVAVRIALGATPKNIVYVLIREGNVLVLAGVAVGLYMTKETVEWIGNFVREVDLTNAILFGLLCILLFCAMVMSALVPALRATRMDPMDVLRSE